jgi:hypothetical protein
MTLSIGVDYIDPKTGTLMGYDLGPGGEYLMGFESCRHTVWGHSIMKQPGLHWLPQLKVQAVIYIEGEDLDALEQEALTIQQNVELVMQHTRYDRDFLMFRTNNILRAVKAARELNGRVSIG